MTCARNNRGNKPAKSASLLSIAQRGGHVMINYPQDKDNDLFSDTVITDMEADSADSDDNVIYTLNPGINRKMNLYRYLALHKIEQRKERLRLRKLLEDY